jgi:hypothetical protein
VSTGSALDVRELLPLIAEQQASLGKLQQLVVEHVLSESQPCVASLGESRCGLECALVESYRCQRQLQLSGRPARRRRLDDHAARPWRDPLARVSQNVWPGSPGSNGAFLDDAINVVAAASGKAMPWRYRWNRGMLRRS